MKKLKLKSNKHKERNPIPVLFVSAEGKNKTEINYFNNFQRQNKLSVRRVPGDETAPKQLLERLIAEVKKDDQAENLGICLVDTDFDPVKNKQLLAADAMLKN